MPIVGQIIDISLLISIQAHDAYTNIKMFVCFFTYICIFFPGKTDNDNHPSTLISVNFSKVQGMLVTFSLSELLK